MYKQVWLPSLCAIALVIVPSQAQEKREKVLALVQQLETGTDAAKLTAAVALADFGPDAEPAVPALVKVLQGKGEDLRLNAAIALGKIGAPAVGPVAKVLSSKYPNDRYYAIWTLAWIGPAAKETAPLVIAALADKDEGVRRKAAYTLGRIAPEPKTVIGPLIKILADGNNDVRQAAADTLAKFGTLAVPPLIEALKDDSASIRAEAARALGNIGSDAKDAVPHLKPLFIAGQGNEWLQAAEALAKIGKPSLPVLGELVKSDNSFIRTRAVQTMGKIGAEAVPMLVDALADKNPDVRRAAVTALSPLRISDKMVVLALAHAADDADPQVRQQCLQALRLLGSGAKLAVPKLVKVAKTTDEQTLQGIISILQTVGEADQSVALAVDLLKDGSAKVRSAAVNLLGSQGPKAIPHLIVALRDQELTVRFAAVNAIQRTPGDIKDALPALVPLLKQGMVFQRRGVVNLLGRVGEPAVPHLITCLREPDNFTRSSAAQALAGIGADAKKAVPTLSDMVLQDTFVTARTSALQAVASIEPDKLNDLFAKVKKHPDEKVRASAYSALYTRFGKKGSAGVVTLSTKLTVPHLIDATKDGSGNIRLIGVQGLGMLGADAKAIIPAVTALLDDPDVRVRMQAALTLKQIKGK